MRESVRGLFITGTDTGVGKTYVAALVARALAAEGRRVGVYKPVASGCRRQGDRLVSDDALSLWEAAGRPGELERVCPQRFAAPLAPHLAARAEDARVDEEQLRRGLDYWIERSDIVIVEGVGGLMSPLTDDEYVADLAYEFGYPLVVVAQCLGGDQSNAANVDYGGHIPSRPADCRYCAESIDSGGRTRHNRARR